MRRLSTNPSAQNALQLVNSLQNRLLKSMLKLYPDTTATPVEWLRDQGTCGGGMRYELVSSGLNTASINVSQVHYDSALGKPLEVATALSTIIHPDNPHSPSMHLHISKTTMHSGKSYWRIMADLNPAICSTSMVVAFNSALAECAGSQFDYAKAQGEKYFYIPALQRHRGVAHFYLEQYATEAPEKDEAFAEIFGRTMIETYTQIVAYSESKDFVASENERDQQRAYHTLYLFQVLTLDRGTTAGIMAHSDNDIGILGSLPARVDLTLLRSWMLKLSETQSELVARIIDCFGNNGGVVDRNTKLKLAHEVRSFYQKYPVELQNQASGFVVPQSMLLHNNQTQLI